MTAKTVIISVLMSLTLFGVRAEAAQRINNKNETTARCMISYNEIVTYPSTHEPSQTNLEEYQRLAEDWLDACATKLPEYRDDVRIARETVISQIEAVEA